MGEKLEPPGIEIVMEADPIKNIHKYRIKANCEMALMIDATVIMKAAPGAEKIAVTNRIAAMFREAAMKAQFTSIVKDPYSYENLPQPFFGSYPQVESNDFYLMVTCEECGIRFGIQAGFLFHARSNGRKFYCPNGHGLPKNGRPLDLPNVRLIVDDSPPDDGG